jgi:hypothetical protein
MTLIRPFRPAAAAALALALAAGLALAPATSRAHAEHGKPQHGGVVAEAGTFQGELVAGPKGATLYITDHGAPVPTAGASAKLVVLSGAQKAERELVPAGDNRLAVAGDAPLAKGAKAVATVKLKDGRSGALRFDVK